MKSWRYNAARKADLKRNYGLTVDDYCDLAKKQRYSCAICGIHQMKLKSKLFVDHNHVTGKIRGLLCPACNLLVGYAEHQRLQEAYQYLNKYK